MASCSNTGTFFHVPSNPFICNGGNENSLTVELPLRISFRTRKADSVPFMYTLSICSISASSLGIPGSPSLFEVAVADALGAQPSSPTAASAKAGCSFAGKRRSSIASHSLTSLKSRSVVKKGCCSTFCIKGRRISAPVLLSYFLRILARPVEDEKKACKFRSGGTNWGKKKQGRQFVHWWHRDNVLAFRTNHRHTEKGPRN